MGRQRFFSNNSESEPSAGAPKGTKMASGGGGGGSGGGNGGTSSRWRRPRLRRSDAHEFNEGLLAAKEKITAALSRDSLCSGCSTEAPSSRGTSASTASLSTTCSPSQTVAADGVPGVEDFDLDGGEDWITDCPPDDVLPGDSAAGVDEFAGRDTTRRFAGPLSLHVQDFECGECVGKGSYSRVFVATHAPTRTEWALKVVSKRKTFETRENLAHLREERYISTKLQGSDFLVRTAGTFQNTRSVVFAMEYLPGGDLYQRLADKGTLSVAETVAWSAQALLALEDLHAKNIVHRDVKPENFLMGRSGTLKLTDFGFARELEPDERLYSQFGTPEYVAPEVLNGCGHGMPVDMWALGVLIYELLVGHTPFKSASVDEMYERIAAGDYTFPPPPAPPARARPSAPPTAEGSATKSPKAAKSPRVVGSPKPVRPCSPSKAPRSFGAGCGGLAVVDKNISSNGSNSSKSRLPRDQPPELENPGHKQQKQQPQRGPESSSPAATTPTAPKSRTATPKNSTSTPTSSSKTASNSGAQDPAAQSLVKALLCLSPGRRPSIAEVKRHRFFAGVDFEGLRAAVRAQADREEEEAVVAAAIDGEGEVWIRGQPVECLSEEVDDNYGGVFAGF